jgi:uncharacterized membrane protein
MANLEAFTSNAKEALEEVNPANPDSPLSGAKGAAAGVALAVLPIAVERVVRFAGDKASQKMPSDKLSEKVSDLGGKAAGKARDATDKVTPDMPKGDGGGMIGKIFSGGDDDDDGGGKLGKLFSRGGGDDDAGGGDSDSDGDGDSRAAPGYGSGRRMPIQQSVDVGLPLSKVYDAWTQYEEWPRFMHRVDSVDQSDETTVAFSTKTWGITKRFEAKILVAHPDERIEWTVEQGLSHAGVVTFHKLSDRLTRIEVTVDVEPDSLLEKMGRGMRYAKRAVRGDLHRFKAYVELYEDEIEKGWRGTIEDGEVKRRTERKPARRSSNGSRGGSSRSSGGSQSRSKGGSSQSRSNGSSARSRSRQSTSGRSRSGSRSSS